MPILFLLATLGLSTPIAAQQGTASHPVPLSTDQPPSHGETTQDYNQRIAQLARETKAPDVSSPHADYQIGPEDLLEISVLEAPDLTRTVRVSDDGTVSLALLGSIQTAGLTTRELQSDLQERLRHTYMKDPQVSVFVQEMRSHPVSVFGAVEKPGVYQIRSAKTLIEVLSMAQGLAIDAGDTVIVMRHPGDMADLTFASLFNTNSTLRTDHPAEIATPAQGPSGLATAESAGSESITINLKDLLDSSNPRSNVLVYPGDLVKVARAGIVYVVGQVRKPGGFLLKTNENISVLQAIALAEGLTQRKRQRGANLSGWRFGRFSEGNRHQSRQDHGRQDTSSVPETRRCSVHTEQCW
jgi:protein involved in polysaccharide export with SLBB domain